MTGPEHYMQAENLLTQAEPRDPQRDQGLSRLAPFARPEEREQMIAKAQVHAVLALAAATALGSGGREGADSMSTAGRARQAWERAAGEESSRG
jgi:hypothetical protein